MYHIIGENGNMFCHGMFCLLENKLAATDNNMQQNKQSFSTTREHKTCENMDISNK